MSNPTHIGELATAVVQAARLRREMPREQRLELGAATLLAFLIHAHGDDAEAVLLAASEAYVHTRTRSFAVAQVALSGLEDVAGLCERYESIPPGPQRNLLILLKDSMRKTNTLLEYEQSPIRSERETLPPFEVRCDCDRSGINGTHEDHCATV